jgi:hypothetical protein
MPCRIYLESKSLHLLTCTGGQVWTGSKCVCPVGLNYNGRMCVECINGQKWDTKLQLAHVNQVSSGMDNFVKNPTAVQMVECGALSTTNVFAPMDPTGVATTACLSRNVMVDNTSTLP